MHTVRGLIIAMLVLGVRVAIAADTETVRVLGKSSTLVETGTGTVFTRLDSQTPARFQLQAGRYQVDFKVNLPVGDVAPPQAVIVSVFSGGNPVKAYRVSPKPGAGSWWKEGGSKPSTSTAFFVETAATESWEFRVQGGGAEGAAISIVPAALAPRPLAATAPVLRAPIATAAAPSTAVSTPVNEPAARAAPVPAAPQEATASPRSRFTVWAEAGYVANTGDLGALAFGAGGEWRPWEHGLLRNLGIEFGAERYSESGSRTSTDPTIGEYTRSYRFDVLPVFAGIAWSQSAGAIGLVASADAGIFVVDGSWKATNEQGAIEPAERLGAAVPGIRLGIAAVRPLGPGDLAAVVRWRKADIDNGERFDPVYPQDRSTYRVLGDVGGASLSIGYRISF